MKLKKKKKDNERLKINSALWDGGGGGESLGCYHKGLNWPTEIFFPFNFVSELIMIILGWDYKYSVN